MAAGETAALKDWLAGNIWPHGRSVNAEELVERVTGRPLGAQPFLTYLRAKVGQLTGAA